MGGHLVVHDQKSQIFLAGKTQKVEQGWCSGESSHLPPVWPSFDSQTWHHTWVEFVVGSCPCSERFSSGYLTDFLLSSKTNTLNLKLKLSPMSALHKI